MASSRSIQNAERNQRARAVAGLEPGVPAAPKRQSVVHQIRQKSGLEWLLDKEAITSAQFAAGNRYAELYRGVSLASEVSIKSNLNDSGGSGDGMKLGRSLTELRTAEWIADCGHEIALARVALRFHTDVQVAVDVICAKGWVIRDLTNDPRAADSIETRLSVGLDILVAHFRERDLARRMAST